MLRCFNDNLLTADEFAEVSREAVPASLPSVESEALMRARNAKTRVTSSEVTRVCFWQAYRLLISGRDPALQE